VYKFNHNVDVFSLIMWAEKLLVLWLFDVIGWSIGFGLIIRQ